MILVTKPDCVFPDWSQLELRTCNGLPNISLTSFQRTLDGSVGKPKAVTVPQVIPGVCSVIMEVVDQEKPTGWLKIPE